jgi:hypothetical protein
MAELPPELFQHWVHAHEQDHGDLQVYRPAGYPLPPARGRRGFELKPGGELILYGPGPSDRPEVTAARWSPSGAGRVRLGDRELEIVSLSGDRLTARWSAP